MSLDIAKLEKVREEGGKTIARCPACAERGMDTKGEHLVIRADGRFGCVVNPGDGGKAHRQRIFALVGKRTKGVPHIKVRSTAQLPMNTPAPLRKWDGWDGNFKPSRVQRKDDSDKAGQYQCTISNGNLPSQPSHFHHGASACKPPDLSPIVHCLEYADPTFRDPQNGEVVVGLYREDDGTAAALLLWADTKADLFWDVAIRQRVRPPKFYMRLSEQPPIDPGTGYPIIEGAVCPF